MSVASNTVRRKAPLAPTNLVLTTTGGFVNVSWHHVASNGLLDKYEVWSSVEATEGYTLIGVVPGSEITETCSFTDAAVGTSEPIYYRIYAVKNGAYSTALEGSVSITGTVGDVQNFVVTAHYDFYELNFKLPDDYRLDRIEIRVAKSGAPTGMSEAGATLVYTGLTEHYLYSVPDADLNLYHQFFVKTIGY